jgi:hypothetical protein
LVSVSADQVLPIAFARRFVNDGDLSLASSGLARSDGTLPAVALLGVRRDVNLPTELYATIASLIPAPVATSVPIRGGDAALPMLQLMSISSANLPFATLLAQRADTQHPILTSSTLLRQDAIAPISTKVLIRSDSGSGPLSTYLTILADSPAPSAILTLLNLITEIFAPIATFLTPGFVRTQDNALPLTISVYLSEDAILPLGIPPGIGNIVVFLDDEFVYAVLINELLE